MKNLALQTKSIMRMPSLAICCLLLHAAFFVPNAVAQGPAPTPDQVEFFEKRIRPVLVNQCFSCHSKDAKKLRGGLHLDTRAGLRKGGTTGPVVVPGQPDKSLLIQAIRYHTDLRMPPKGKLSALEIADFETWVMMGAPDPRVDKMVVAKNKIASPTDPRDLWYLKPVKRFPTPAVADKNWSANPIDAFVFAKLQEKGLKPVPLADKLTLLRRATYDLIGLPPTPEEIDAFQKDDSPDAFAKVVDRLLASPHYGERWGRQWLDLVRYADTAGDNSDFPVPQLVLYRDWVIDAFNRDMPYNRFVQEQLAGDLLKADSDQDRAQKIIATGYLANSRRHGSYEDKRYPWHLTIEDTIDNLGKTFLGLTIHCARCHDHKFDPISAEDYYALYGFFSSTRYPRPGIELDRVPVDFIPLPKSGLAYAVIDGKNEPNKRSGRVGNVKLQLKGDPDHLGKEVPRRFPTVLGGMTLPADVKGSGRLQLANWLTDPANPLFARVMVNRLWQFHFGQGIVATPNNFGKQGQTPTHPELLDTLAQTFIDKGWSIKSMHRLIMLTRAYRLDSADDEYNLKLDPNNEYLWRFSRRRLDAESIRDTLLAVSGKLDRTPGGPHPFPEPKSWKFSQHNPFKAVYDSNRRSVYLMTQRIQRHPFLALFDGPDTNAGTASRPISTTPLQALFLMNNPLVHDSARAFAKRLLTDSKDDTQRVERAFLLCFGRPASADDNSQSRGYLAAVRSKFAARPVPEQESLAWESFARVLFMSNEFVYP